MIVVHFKLSEVTSSAELIVAVQRLPILRALTGGAGVAYADSKEASASAPMMVEMRSMVEMSQEVTKGYEDGMPEESDAAALLHAILTNYNAHSEATKSAKHAEMELKDQLEEVEVAKEKLESELRR